MIKMNEIMKAIISHTNSKPGPKGLNTITNLPRIEGSSKDSLSLPKNLFRSCEYAFHEQSRFKKKKEEDQNAL
jgi:hypothetical protein